MAYYNEDQLRRYFEKAIKRESEEQILKLQNEIDYLYNRELKKVTDDIEIKKQVQMAKELKKVQINYQEELNQIGIGYDEKLIMRRREMANQVFHVIEEKLLAFVKTENYVAWLKKRIREHAKHVKGYDIIIQIALHDEVIEDIIKTELTALSCSIVPSKEVAFGGFILTLPKKQIEVDETLDARLYEQRDWFLNHSKLFIRR